MGLGYTDLLVAQQGAGTAFGSFTTAKSVINAEALRTLPSGYFYIGKSLSIKVRGAISNIVTTPGTITFQTVIGGIVAFTTGAIQLNATAHTLLPFALDIDLTCRAIGASTSANLMGLGRISGMMVTATAGQTDGANTMATLMCPATAPAVGTGFDSTIANILDFYAGFSINNSGNVIRIDQYKVFEDN